MEYSLEAVGVSNKETLMETRKYLLPGYIRPLTTVVCIVFLCQSIYELIHASTFMSFFFLLLAIIVNIIYRYSLIFVVNRHMQIIKGYMHTENMIYQLRFGEDHLYLSISTTSKCTLIPYSNFTEIIESKNLYLLKTRSGNHVIITKDSLNNILADDWKNFLRKKCTAAKCIKFRK